jgi:SNF2 family DNA or RNA helicase
MEEVEASVPAGKVVIFSHYRRMLRLLRRSLLNRGLDYSLMAGDVPVQARGGVVAEFEREPSKRVLLATYGTGGEGLNLTAANVVLMAEPWYNPACEYQAAARVLRIGQSRDVRIVRFVTKDTVEQRIEDIRESKLALLDFVDGGEAILQGRPLTRDELYRLLT